MSTRHTPDQLRAKHAYHCVNRVAEDASRLSEYRIAVNALGPNIMRNGLVAAIAFLSRTGTDGSQQFAADLAARVADGKVTDDPERAGPALTQWAISLDLATYQRKTREVLRQAHWFKRATQAYDEDQDA